MTAGQEWWQSPEAQEFLQSAIDEMTPKLRGSALVVQLVPTEFGDAKFWVELGASIMLDKPIIAVSIGGRGISEKLRRVADEVVEVPDLDTLENSEEVTQAIHRVLERLDAGADL